MNTYEQMTTQPNRRCRPETLLRLLMSTSYPQSILSDLTLAIALHGGQTDPDELEQDAQGMREVEKSYTLFDFIRCIEIKRNGPEVTVIAKCLDIDPTMRTINDSSATHVQMAASTIKLAKGDSPLESPDQLAIRLLEFFYRSQVKSKRPNDSIDRTTWRYRNKVQDRSKPLNQRENMDVEVGVKEAIEKLTGSLNKKHFHVVLTQNTILLLDQKARLYGVRNK